MRLWIDGSEVSRDVSALRTFGEVMEEAGRRAVAVGRVVSRVSVDGREISTRAEREMAARPPEEFAAVHVSTATPGELLREALDGGLDLCGAILRDVRAVASLLKAGDLPAATSLYASCIESLATFFELAGAVFHGIRSGAFPLSADASSGADALPSPPPSTSEILERLLAARKSEDWATMALLLEDRIAPNLSEWSGFFSAIRGPGAK